MTKNVCEFTLSDFGFLAAEYMCPIVGIFDYDENFTQCLDDSHFNVKLAHTLSSYVMVLCAHVLLPANDHW